ncbi:hypothetical protein KBTX_01632 [wastewater metagenome]|uniref:N-acetyltransferase domain-containing protein n=3 Tax=root TaxID=1 RepID=A0A5B8RD01_9ZZZZ|nr:hypothetical protein KBTEX_01632 [uncultured organism]
MIGIRAATMDDADAVTACVHAAYRHYVPRLGCRPGPMDDGYRAAIAAHDVFVAVADDVVAGVLVLVAEPHACLLDNVAVDPGMQGRGIGRRLLAWAEQWARERGYAAIRLYTHERMTENQALYARLGYATYRHRTENGLARVYMCKRLDSSGP